MLRCLDALSSIDAARCMDYLGAHLIITFATVFLPSSRDSVIIRPFRNIVAIESTERTREHRLEYYQM
jgi:hypothetical protein